MLDFGFRLVTNYFYLLSIFCKSQRLNGLIFYVKSFNWVETNRLKYIVLQHTGKLQWRFITMNAILINPINS